jgi:hypothetical protein
MPDSLAALEAQRTEILRQFLALGDLRRGSITAVARRCGKPSCHCAKANDAGHDPQIRLTRKVKGKTVAETFSSPSVCRKAQAEVAEFHRFQRLSEELVDTNEKICKLRLVQQGEDGWSAQEKKRLLRSMKRSKERLRRG